MTREEPSREFVHDLLNTIFYNDAHEDLFWSCTGEYAPITFFINCSDVFWWTTEGITEEVNEDTLPLLKQSYKDGGGIYGGDLYVARRRMLRPQRPYLDRIEDEKIKAHFLAAGPEREEEG